MIPIISDITSILLTSFQRLSPSSQIFIFHDFTYNYHRFREYIRRSRDYLRHSGDYFHHFRYYFPHFHRFIALACCGQAVATMFISASRYSFLSVVARPGYRADWHTRAFIHTTVFRNVY